MKTDEEVRQEMKGVVLTAFTTALTGLMFVSWASENLTEAQANAMLDAIAAESVEKFKGLVPSVDASAEAEYAKIVKEVADTYRSGLSTIYNG